MAMDISFDHCEDETCVDNCDIIVRHKMYIVAIQRFYYVTMDLVSVH